MAENLAKRNYLPIGSFRNKDSLDFQYPGAQCVWSTQKQKFINSGWYEPSEFLISLGIPIGNSFDVSAFINGRYRSAKSKLASAFSIKTIGLVGKNRLLQANYYGMFRYYLWSLTFPHSTLRNIASDASAFLWRREPGLDANEEGTHRSLGKWIAEKATHRSVRTGGAGIMHFPSHVKAFYASWIRRLIEPREATWKEVVQHWLPIPRGHLLSVLSPTEKKTSWTPSPRRRVIRGNLYASSGNSR